MASSTRTERCNRAPFAALVDGDGDGENGTFSTMSAPLHLHPALDHLLCPEVILGEILAYAGPAGVAKLRNFPLFRQRMANLHDHDLLRSGLLFCGEEGRNRDRVGGGRVPSASNRYIYCSRQPSEEVVTILRACLMKRSPPSGAAAASRPSRPPIAPNGRVMLRARTDDVRDRRPTELCLLALARHSLSSERCLRNIIRCLGQYERTRRIRGDNCPPTVRYGAIALAVAENPAASVGVLDDLFEWERDRAAEELTRNRHQDAWNDAWNVGSTARDCDLLRAIAENDNASPCLLRRLADEESTTVRAAVAGNERAPGDVLAALAADDRAQAGLVLMSVGRNPRTPERDLVGLSLSDRIEAREAVASNAHTPPVALQALASKDDVQVLIALSCNDALPHSILRELSRDERWTVRRNVARHPNAEPEVLRAYLRDRSESHWVRLAAAWNSNLAAEEVASMLDAEEHPEDGPVVAGTSRDPALLDRLARDISSSSETVCRDVAGNAFASPGTLTYLSRSHDVRVRVILALNPAAPPELLRDVLLADPDPHVRAVAVRNPSTAPDMLTRLATAATDVDAPLDEEMMEALASDDKSTPQCLAALHRRIDCELPEDDPDLSSPSRHYILELLALNPRSPPGVLSKLSMSASAEVRAAVASHRRLPTHTLARMAMAGGGGGRLTSSSRSVLLGVAQNPVIQTVADLLSCSIAAPPS